MEPVSTFRATLILTLDAEAMRGRDGYRTGIRPDHRLPGAEHDFFMGQIDFDDCDLLKPGESTRATGNFIVYTKDVDLFRPGFRWEICEASTVVGSAELVSRGEARSLAGSDAEG